MKCVRKTGMMAEDRGSRSVRRLVFHLHTTPTSGPNRPDDNDKSSQRVLGGRSLPSVQAHNVILVWESWPFSCCFEDVCMSSIRIPHVSLSFLFLWLLTQSFRPVYLRQGCELLLILFFCFFLVKSTITCYSCHISCNAVGETLSPPSSMDSLRIT